MSHRCPSMPLDAVEKARIGVWRCSLRPPFPHPTSRHEKTSFGVHPSHDISTPRRFRRQRPAAIPHPRRLFASLAAPSTASRRLR